MKGEKFTDPNFPPDDRSLFFDPNNPRETDLKKDVQKWVRISDLFNKTKYIKLTFFDEEAFRLCGFETMEASEFERLSSVDDCPSMEKATQKAQELCLTALGSTDPVQEELEALVADSPIKDWLQKNDIFGTLRTHLSPLVLKEFGDPKFEYVAQEGYVPTLAVTLPCGCGPPDAVHFFQRGTPDQPFVAPGDVAQGALGDCYFLGALSVLSANEELLFDAFPDLEPGLWLPSEDAPPNEQQFNPEGVYAVAFYRNRERRVVVVDDWIPCTASGRPAFCQPPRDGTEIWTLIAEKAFAKLNGSFEGIVGGLEKEALQDLTGGLPLQYEISGENAQEKWRGAAGLEELHNTLKDILEEGSMLGCSVQGEVTEADLGAGILANHAYGILKTHDLVLDGQEHRLIQIRNPWGRGQEWTGAWGDEDPRWARVAARDKEDMGYVDEDDGTWWMTLEDFREQFQELSVCRLLRPPVWQHHHVIGKWEGTSAAGTENLHLNPQFQLYLEHDCKVFVELRQPSRRPLGKDTYEVAVAPVVVGGENTPDQRRVRVQQEDLEGDLVLAHARSRVAELQLRATGMPGNPGATPYQLLALASQAGYEAEFFMEVYTRGPSAVRPLHDHAVPRCAQCAEVLTGAFVTVDEKYLHKECYRDYKATTAPRCAHCGEGVLKVEGRFSGRFYPLDDGVQVHSECYPAYQAAAAPDCGHCGEKVFKQPGRFSGVYYDTEDQQRVHEECWEGYRLSKAPKCVECGEPVARVEGRFDGKYYNVDDGGRCHSECWDQHRQSTAPKCIHCGGPCCEVEGRFSGMFYELDPASGGDGGHCHVECFDDYTAAQQR